MRVRHEIPLGGDFVSNPVSWTGTTKYACTLTPKMYSPVSASSYWYLEVKTDANATITLVGEDNVTYATINAVAGTHHSIQFTPLDDSQIYYLNSSVPTVNYYYARVIFDADYVSGKIISQEIQYLFHGLENETTLEHLDGYHSFPFEAEKWGDNCYGYLEMFVTMAPGSIDYSLNAYLYEKQMIPNGSWVNKEYLDPNEDPNNSGAMMRYITPIMKLTPGNAYAYEPNKIESNAQYTIHSARFIVQQTTLQTVSLPASSTQFTHSLTESGGTYHLYGGYRVYAGGTYCPSKSIILDSIKTRLSKVGSPTGNLYIDIVGAHHSSPPTSFSADNNFGGDLFYVPLKTSDALDISTMSSGSADCTFTFSGDEFVFAENMMYQIFVRGDFVSSDSSNRIALILADYTYVAGADVQNVVFQSNSTGKTVYSSTATLAYLEIIGQEIDTIKTHNRREVFMGSSKFGQNSDSYDQLFGMYISLPDQSPFELKSISLKIDVPEYDPSLNLKHYMKIYSPVLEAFTQGTTPQRILYTRQLVATSTNYITNEGRGTFTYYFPSGVILKPNVDYVAQIEIQYSGAVTQRVKLYGSKDYDSGLNMTFNTKTGTNAYGYKYLPDESLSTQGDVVWVAEYSIAGKELGIGDYSPFVEKYQTMFYEYPPESVTDTPMLVDGIPVKWNPLSWSGFFIRPYTFISANWTFDWAAFEIPNQTGRWARGWNFETSNPFSSYLQLPSTATDLNAYIASTSATNSTEITGVSLFIDCIPPGDYGGRHMGGTIVRTYKHPLFKTSLNKIIQAIGYVFNSNKTKPIQNIGVNLYSAPAVKVKVNHFVYVIMFNFKTILARIKMFNVAVAYNFMKFKTGKRIQNFSSVYSGLRRNVFKTMSNTVLAYPLLSKISGKWVTIHANLVIANNIAKKLHKNITHNFNIYKHIQKKITNTHKNIVGASSNIGYVFKYIKELSTSIAIQKSMYFKNVFKHLLSTTIVTMNNKNILTQKYISQTFGIANTINNGIRITVTRLASIISYAYKKIPRQYSASVGIKGDSSNKAGKVLRHTSVTYFNVLRVVSKTTKHTLLISIKKHGKTVLMFNTLAGMLSSSFKTTSKNMLMRINLIVSSRTKTFISFIVKVYVTQIKGVKKTFKKLKQWIKNTLGLNTKYSRWILLPTRAIIEDTETNAVIDDTTTNAVINDTTTKAVII